MVLELDAAGASPATGEGAGALKRRLEEAIDGVMTRMSEPEWAPFRPGTSYFAPPWACSSSSPVAAGSGIMKRMMTAMMMMMATMIRTKDGGEENKKGEGQEAAFIWTADDAKNLMDLGYSEMERNRRLEILMVRRRSRKKIVFEIDNNLTDANGKNVDDLSRFGAQVSHISVTRRNPFDLPYDSDEAAIPGSAPSILHARKNPFDFLEHSSESGVSAHDNLSPGESPPTSHRDIF
ncbi:dentin sialophosphoprotein-like [Hordeum vulgare]|nr:dentin sialophosphoprotein-like [Hordeum vulgare]